MSYGRFAGNDIERSATDGHGVRALTDRRVTLFARPAWACPEIGPPPCLEA